MNVIKSVISVMTSLYNWIFGDRNTNVKRNNKKQPSPFMNRLQRDRKMSDLLCKKEKDECVIQLREFRQELKVDAVIDDSVIVKLPEKDIRKQFREWKESVKKYEQLRNLWVMEKAVP